MFNKGKEKKRKEKRLVSIGNTTYWLQYFSVSNNMHIFIFHSQNRTLFLQFSAINASRLTRKIAKTS